MYIQKIQIKYKFLIIFLSLLTFIPAGFSQEQPFAHEINQFRVSDSLNPPPQNAILFVGSSSFRMWSEVQRYFPGYTIINRGFGGSSIPDLIRYAEVVIFPYDSKQIVIYCGENDLAASDTVTGEMVAQRFIVLFNMIREKLPGVPVIYISMKPSPSRWHLSEKMITGNNTIKDFLVSQKNASFVNIWEDMMNDRLQPDSSLFLEDMLHMNEKGYRIWQQAIEPELIR